MGVRPVAGNLECCSQKFRYLHTDFLFTVKLVCQDGRGKINEVPGCLRPWNNNCIQAVLHEVMVRLIPRLVRAKPSEKRGCKDILV